MYLARDSNMFQRPGKYLSLKMNFETSIEDFSVQNDFII